MGELAPLLIRVFVGVFVACLPIKAMNVMTRR